MSGQRDRPSREGRSWQRNAAYWTIIVGGFIFTAWQVARFFDWPQPGWTFQLQRKSRPTRPTGPDILAQLVRAGEQAGWLDKLAEEPWEELMARGRAAFNAARFNEARRCFATAAQRSTEGEIDHARFADSAGHLARVYQIEGLDNEAKHLFRHALRHDKPVSVDRGTPGAAQRRSHVIEEVERLPLNHPSMIRPTTWDAILVLRGHEDWSGRLRDVTKPIDELGTSDKAGEVLARAECGRLLALQDAYFHHNSMVELTRAVDLAAEHLDADDPIAARARWSMAAVLTEMGDADGAETYFAQAMPVLEKIYSGDHPILAEAYHDLGRLHLLRGEPEQARKRLEQSLRIYEQVCGSQYHLTAYVLMTLGEALLELEQSTLARDCFRRATDILELEDPTRPYQKRVSRPRTTHRAWAQLAAASERVGDYDQAIAAIERAIPLGEDLDRYNKYEPRWRPEKALLARYLAAKGRHAEAAEAFEEYLGFDKPDRVLTSVTAKLVDEDKPGWRSGISRQYKSDPALAGRVPLQARWRSRPDDEPRIWYGPYRLHAIEEQKRLAETYRRLGRTAEAEVVEQDVQATTARWLGPNNGDPAKKHLYHAALGAGSHDWPTALDAFAQALPVRAELRWRSLNWLDADDAKRHNWVYGDARLWHAIISTALHARGHHPDAAAVAMDAVLAYKSAGLDAAARRLRLIQTSGNPEVTRLYEQFIQTRRELANLVPEGHHVAEDTAEHRRIHQLDRQRLALGDKLVEAIRSDTEFVAPDLPTWQAVADALPPDAVLISFMHLWDMAREAGLDTRKTYVALTLRHGQRPKLHGLGRAADLDQALEQFNKDLISASDHIRQYGAGEASAWVTHAAHHLSDSVLGPIWHELRDVRHWIIAPDGVLAQLPFAILLEPDSQRYVIEEHEVSYVFSGRDVLRFGDAPTGQEVALIIANPDFNLQPTGIHEMSAHERALSRLFEGARWSPLPGTKREADALVRLLKDTGIAVDLRTGPDADDEALLQAEAPQILHVATHGFFVPDRSMKFDYDPFVIVRRFDRGKPLSPVDPMFFNGLVLAGANQPQHRTRGLVSAFELVGMNLTGTRLVVLSACETGLGGVTAGSGVRGLQRSFQQSGAASVVMSMWRLPDLETAELMEDFYKEALAGKRLSAALRLAMIQSIERSATRHQTRHPYYWGAFSLYGDPGRIDPARN